MVASCAPKGKLHVFDGAELGDSMHPIILAGGDVPVCLWAFIPDDFTNQQGRQGCQWRKSL